MKKTYKESWFVRTDNMRNSMAVGNLFSHNPTAQLSCDSGIWTNLVLLQVESPMEKGYCVCEVIRKEDYDKYQEYSLDYMKKLEGYVEDLKTTIDRLNSEISCNEDIINSLTMDVNKLNTAMNVINYCAEIVCEDGHYTLKIKDSCSGVHLTLSEYQAMKKIGLDIRDIDNSGKWDINKESVMDE